MGALLLGVALTGAPDHAALAGSAETDSLAAGFENPPMSARPRVWWHWMNGNVTKDGIAKDLDWMSRVGIGGLQTFDVDLMTPQIVPHRLVYMSPEWKDAFRFAAGLADEKGLELAIASSPGWSETGGPWVKPEDAMKKLVWSETILAGGQPFQGVLAQPPKATGPMGDLAEEPSFLGPPDPNKPQIYADAAVVAYRIPDAPAPAPVIALAGGASLEAGAIQDGKLSTGLEIARGDDKAPTTLVFSYPAPVTIRTLVIALSPNNDVFGFGGAQVAPRLEAEDGSGGWKQVAQVDLRGAAQTTISFAAVTAQHFRIVFEPAPRSNENPFSGVPGAQVFDFGAAPPLKTITIKELRLESEPRVNRFELKAGFGVAPSYFALDLGLQDEPGVAIQDVIDLTSHMAPDGRLDWTPPPGRWRVLRLGYSLTGTTNHPTTKEASGLEVDKLDGPAVRRYLETYLSLYSDAAGGDRIGQHGVRALLTDSIEVGAANWTPKMLDDFQRLRGYDPRPWLPVLTGAVIGSRAQSDAFLYDYRRTLADLLASQHYGTVADVAHEHGLKLYGEALEDRRPMLGDDLTMRSHTDVPMSALWTYDPAKGPKPSYLGDMRGAASVAHIYGQNVVAAESLTAAFSPWAFAPHDLKKFIDLEFASGVNRPVIHTSVHQPLDDKQPGLSLFIFGQYFNRHETWAEMARPWIDYISRSAYLLQQGRNVADVAYFIGEERPITQLYEDHALGDLPRTYAFDFVDADIVLGKLSVDGQELVSPAGARYRALYLGGDSRRMTLPVLKKLAALAEAGGVIVGAAPTATPSLADDQKAFDDLVHQLWSGAPITAVGRGKVIASTDIEASLGQMGQRPDFRYDDPAGDRKVLFVHRRTPDADIYFVDNRKDRPEAFDAHFRIAGRTPEIWRAETGAAEPVSYRIEEAETRVPLEMRPYDAFFVVFRRPAHTAVRTIAKAAWRPALTLDRGWDVTFQPERGARAEAHFDKLASLSDNADPGVRYFSGVATYRTSFHADALRPGQRAQLDLGRIGDVGQVLVNGVAVGTAWNAPYRMDVTKALRPGENRLEVRIADLWVNRLIGDQQPGAKKITFTVAPTYKPDAPLRPSGLMGPVRLLTTR
ncbi:glycoside hydrolase [Phenylobacterium montanum]|uniref:Glycoside hydrolase n=2 Tax=Phenylobacterium montanum TaxID=2823693 RepID=A0A975G432_9CAUL|nr:glycoside hydrolase [Caulobacter sp. S6]